MWRCLLTRMSLSCATDGNYCNWNPTCLRNAVLLIYARVILKWMLLDSFSLTYKNFDEEQWIWKSHNLSAGFSYSLSSLYFYEQSLSSCCSTPYGSLFLFPLFFHIFLWGLSTSFFLCFSVKRGHTDTTKFEKSG